jgi:hypothetical protein
MSTTIGRPDTVHNFIAQIAYELLRPHLGRFCLQYAQVKTTFVIFQI